MQVLLNLKQLSVHCFSDSPVTLSLTKKGKGVVTAGDFEKNSDVEIINPDLKILTINGDKTTIDMEITIGKGRGYVPVEEKDSKSLDLGTILIDSLYTPIRDVGYKVELTRVGDVTDYEKLVLNIETNGTITPRDAVSQATKLLMDHLVLVLEAAQGEGASLDLPAMEKIKEVKLEDLSVDSLKDGGKEENEEKKKVVKAKKAVKKSKKDK